MLKPFAMELYEQYLAGKTAEQLAHENGISIERIKLRLRAASAFRHARTYTSGAVDQVG